MGLRFLIVKHILRVKELEPVNKLQKLGLYLLVQTYPKDDSTAMGIYRRHMDWSWVWK